MTVIVTWKPPGYSMGELAQVYHSLAPLTYAGRLDPLAEGVSLLLTGPDRHRKDDFLGLNKDYIVDVLFGIGTDTHDPLGLVADFSPSAPSQKDIKEALASFSPQYDQVPPAYSSQPIDGEAAFVHARRGDAPDLPAKPISIAAEVISHTSLSAAEILADVTKRIDLVRGDFRQNQIKASWQTLLSDPNAQLTACRLRVTCTSGGYMRSLARDLGKKLDTPAIAYRIVRTRVGQFRLPIPPEFQTPC